MSGEQNDYTDDYTVAEAADRFNVSELTIRRGIKSGALRAYTLDGERYVLCEDVEALAKAVATETANAQGRMVNKTPIKDSQWQWSSLWMLW